MVKIIFLGSPPFALPSLQKLAGSRFNPIAIVTQPARPKGRGQKLEPSTIQQLAKKEGIACFTPHNANENSFLEQMRALRPEIIVVVSFGQILSKDFLHIPSIGCFNVHASLLPQHRGASPIQSAILSGDEKTGVSVQKMVERLDAGDIVSQVELAIGGHATAGELFEQLAELGGELLLKTLEQIASGDWQAIPQEEAAASYARKITKQDGQINWQLDAVHVDRHIRAMTPWPGASSFLLLNNKQLRVKVLRGHPRVHKQGKPGEIVGADANGIEVAAAVGTYCIEQIQQEGKRALPVAEFLKGVKVQPGMIFLAQPTAP